MEQKLSYKWIDMGKLLAMLCVITIHMYGKLYLKTEYIYATTAGVSLFVILSGFSTFLSYEKYTGNLWVKAMKKIAAIYIPYVVATFIYYIFDTDFFYLEEFFKRVLHCTAYGLFYYVSVYIQLTIISPILYRFIADEKRRKNFLGVLVGFVTVCFIAHFTTLYTNVLDIYAGGGMLFGGTFLVVYYIGFCMAAFLPNINNRIIILSGFGVGTVGTILWGIFLMVKPLYLDAFLPFGAGFNPPSISFLIHTILMMTMLFFMEGTIQIIAWKPLEIVYDRVSRLGKHTLFVFMYHMFITDHIIGWFVSQGIVINFMWLKIPVYYIVLYGGSILIEKIYGRVMGYIQRVNIVK
ncbi:MAG: acyltransferase [Lachnospiraceae bacterium]|nr:acyltransferase [Lachnospiraceae bacterium]